MRVLIVEDEASLARYVALGLSRVGFAVDVEHDGAAALVRLLEGTYDVVVLDRDLPGVHGDEICRRLASTAAKTRILMLTAASAVIDKVDGLSLGADDYLTKPFAFDELVARVRALARRAIRPRPPVLTVGDVSLDPVRHVAMRRGIPLNLTPREFSLLEEFLSAPGEVRSAEMLMERVWDENLDPFSNVVRVTLVGLRRKLGDPPIIETIPGVGYRLG